MATLDIFILIVLGIGLIRGFRSGLLKQAASLIGSIMAFALAATFMESAGRLLELKLAVSPEMSSMAAFVGIFILVKIAVYTVAKAANSLLEKVNLTGMDRIAGGLAGGLKAAVILSMVFLMIGMAQLPGKTSRETSEFYMPVYRLVPDAWRFLSDRSPAFEDLRRRVESRLDFEGDSRPV